MLGGKPKMRQCSYLCVRSWLVRMRAGRPLACAIYGGRVGGAEQEACSFAQGLVNEQHAAVFAEGSAQRHISGVVFVGLGWFSQAFAEELHADRKDQRRVANSIVILHQEESRACKSD